jgi:superoxide oxidase
VSARAEEMSAPRLAASRESYDRVIKAVHWSTLLLVAAAYLAMWSSEIVATKELRSLLWQLHYSLGVTVLALTLFRLGWRWRARIPNLPADLPTIQKAAARTTEYFLYVLLLAQPMLGVLYINARGRRIDFYLLGELPSIIGPHKILAEQVIAVHDVMAYVLLSIIGLHAAAALFHHFVRRDNVLSAMLPSRLR